MYSNKRYKWIKTKGSWCNHRVRPRGTTSTHGFGIFFIFSLYLMNSQKNNLSLQRVKHRTPNERGKLIKYSFIRWRSKCHACTFYFLCKYYLHPHLPSAPSVLYSSFRRETLQRTSVRSHYQSVGILHWLRRLGHHNYPGRRNNGKRDEK